MQIIAKTRYLRQSSQKVNLVAALIRRKKAPEALELLDHIPNRAAKSLGLLIRQGIGNAKNNFNLEPGTLIIEAVEVLKGPLMKRSRFASRGRVNQIQKKSSHLKLILQGEKPKNKGNSSRKVREKGSKDGPKS